jgi:hypothetical protein
MGAVLPVRVYTIVDLGQSPILGNAAPIGVSDLMIRDRRGRWYLSRELTFHFISAELTMILLGEDLSVPDYRWIERLRDQSFRLAGKFRQAREQLRRVEDIQAELKPDVERFYETLRERENKELFDQFVRMRTKVGKLDEGGDRDVKAFLYPYMAAPQE